MHFASKSKVVSITKLNNSSQSGPDLDQTIHLLHIVSFVNKRYTNWGLVMGHFRGNLLLSPNLEPQHMTSRILRIWDLFSFLFKIPSWSLNIIIKKKRKYFLLFHGFWITCGKTETLGLWLNLHKATRINRDFCSVVCHRTMLEECWMKY